VDIMLGSESGVCELRHLVAKGLGDPYVPESFSVVASLPRTTIGKVDKKALHAACQAETGSSADDGADHRA
jgi:non-ribosomal peptide synthetase component E (peptide arylation enzyme)